MEHDAVFEINRKPRSPPWTQKMREAGSCPSFPPWSFRNLLGPRSPWGVDVNTSILPLKKLLTSYLRNLFSHRLLNRKGTSKVSSPQPSLPNEDTAERRVQVTFQRPADNGRKRAPCATGRSLVQRLPRAVAVQSRSEPAWNPRVKFPRQNIFPLPNEGRDQLWPIYCADLNHNFIDSLQLKVPGDSFKFWELKNIWPRIKNDW